MDNQLDDLVDMISVEDFANAQPMFAELMASKLHDAIDAEKIRVAGQMFDPDEDLDEEDFEDLEDEDFEEDLDESTHIDEAAKKDWDYKDEALALLKKAEDAGIKVNMKDKYVRGMKAQGPRSPNKANVEALTRALQNGDGDVNYWRG